MNKKRWLAIDLEDFHDSSKRWQGRDGHDTFVRCKVVGGKNLDQAKKCARTGDGRAWYVVSLGSIRSMVYSSTNFLQTPEDKIS
jgi:hypothetical protein